MNLAEREAIRDARRENLTLAEIKSTLAETGRRVSIHVIRKVVDDVAQPVKRTGRRGADPTLKARVLEALVAGVPHRTIARDFGVSTGTLWKWRKA